MSAQSRIKNAQGQWLSHIPNTQLGKGSPWLSQSLLDSLRQAGSLPGASKDLIEFNRAAAAAKLHPGPAFMDPHTPESEAQWSAWCATEKIEAERRWNSRVSYHNSHSTHQKQAFIDSCLHKGKVKFQPTTPMSWIIAPAPYSLCWTDDQGKAALFNGSEAQDLKAHCQTLVALSKLLSKALKSAQKLGASIDPRAIPQSKLLASVPLVAAADALPFEPESEYLSRDCFALYVENGARKGFVTHKEGVLKPDLGSARLFPTSKEAERFAWRYRNSYALVKVNIAPQSFERKGSAGDMRDLAAAISAKEALDIELALQNADIERLRAALQERERSEPPAPRSSRL